MSQNYEVLTHSFGHLPLLFLPANIFFEIYMTQCIYWCIGIHFMECSYSKNMRIINAQSADSSWRPFFYGGKFKCVTIC